MKFLLATIITAATIGYFFFSVAFAASFAKLPYASGQSFLVVQGYNTLPTHIKKDSYALDLTQNGCQAYGKAVVAGSSGNAMLVQEQGYNGGYGTELIIADGNNIVSRYAHMMPGSITLSLNEPVRQGETVGHIGDTGLVMGMACPAHPGTHLHFAMDIQSANGTLIAYDPEPLSGYFNIKAGSWYISDNSEGVDTVGDDQDATGKVLGVYKALSTTGSVMRDATNVPSSSAIAVALPVTTISNGGVSFTVSLPSSPALPVVDVQSSFAAATSTNDASSTANTSSTLIGATSTSDASSSVIASSTPDASSGGVLFTQPDASDNSAPSWYDDNWYDLGNGFSGMLTALTLRGKVSNADFFASHVALQEFKDPNYTSLIQQFIISDNAPFTNAMATATFDGLSITLKPYFYYRLTTVQDYQNRSVILAGTSATGTAMTNNFIYGVGRVEYAETFMPFIIMEGAVVTSTLFPPPLTVPTNLAGTFDDLGMDLTLSWSTSTDPAWPANPLHYEINYSTSTSLDDSNWQASSLIPVVFGNTYLIGVRAADNFGAISDIATTTWNFPTGFAPYVLSAGMRSGSQSFILPFTTNLQSIEIFTADFSTNARNPDVTGCSFVLSYIDENGSYITIPADNGYSGYGCAGNITFSFASSLPLLIAEHQYQWILTASTGNPSTEADIEFYGKQEVVKGEIFSDPSLANARFVLNGVDGVFFSN